jgi:hypothetical protein
VNKIGYYKAIATQGEEAMTKKYQVTLTAEEQEILTGTLNKGKYGARKRKRAQALLLADEHLTDEEIAERTGMHGWMNVPNS